MQSTANLPFVTFLYKRLTNTLTYLLTDRLQTYNLSVRSPHTTVLRAVYAVYRCLFHLVIIAADSHDKHYSAARPTY